MRGTPLTAALLAASPLHAKEKPLLGCWAQDETGVVHAADKGVLHYRMLKDAISALGLTPDGNDADDDNIKDIENPLGGNSLGNLCGKF